MALLSTNRVAWTYTADDGTVYRVAAVDAYVTQAKQGGSDGSAVALPRPSGFKMRRISVRNATLGVSRVVPLYEVGSPLAVAGATINLNHLADSAVFVSSGNPIPEQHIRKSVTEQST
jgi:hypothetical protein